MTLIGAGLGAQAMCCPYGLAAFVLMWQVRANDPMLVMMFLLVYVLLGMVQGAWLGAACGLACALRAQRQRVTAGRVCWIGSLPYVALLAWFFYTAAYTHRDAVKLLILMCGLPLAWAGILLLIGARLLSRPLTQNAFSFPIAFLNQQQIAGGKQQLTSAPERNPSLCGINGTDSSSA